MTAGLPGRLTKELEAQAVLPLTECLDALAGAGLEPGDIEDLKFVVEERRAHLQHELSTDGVCPDFDLEYASALHLWTIEEPLKLFSFLNGHMHSGQRKKGAEGMSKELRACMPFAKVSLLACRHYCLSRHRAHCNDADDHAGSC